MAQKYRILIIDDSREIVAATRTKIGADQVLEKPFEISDLDKLVSKLLIDRVPASLPV